MIKERAVLAGGCFWGMQDLIRRQPGVISTRVGYTGGKVRNATYRNHEGHAEAIEIVFDPEKSCWNSIPNSRPDNPQSPGATIEAPATAPLSSARATSKEKSRKTQSPMSKLRICGLARWSQKSRPPATSGKLIYLESFPAGYTCHFVRPNWKLPRRAG